VVGVISSVIGSLLVAVEGHAVTKVNAARPASFAVHQGVSLRYILVPTSAFKPFD